MLNYKSMNFLFFDVKYLLYLFSVIIGFFVFCDLNLINFNIFAFLFVLICTIGLMWLTDNVIAIVCNIFIALVFITFINEYMYLKPISNTLFFRFFIKNNDGIVYVPHTVLELDYDRLNEKFNIPKFAKNSKYYNNPERLMAVIESNVKIESALENIDYYKLILADCGKNEKCFIDFKTKLMDTYQKKQVKYDKRNYHYYVK